MAMKFLVTFVLLISIGEIYSKSLLEKIRDDSDLSQVSVDNHFWGPFKASKISTLPIRCLWKTKKNKKLENFLASASAHYIIGRRKSVV